MHTIHNVELAGVSACVPKNVETNRDLEFEDFDVRRLIKTTGIEERRVASSSICTSDLCLSAAEKLIEEINWDKNDIKILIFVTQTPDYILPSTAHVVQSKLRLPSDCICIEVNEGCSGFVYGLFMLSSMMSSTKIDKGLLLVGDTISKICSPLDKSTRPLFGDAGTATALRYKEGNIFHFDIGGDGSSCNDIIIEEGGFRNPINDQSLAQIKIDKGISRAKNQLVLDGMNVFQFGISNPPKSIIDLLSYLDKSVEDIDFALFHQANRFMNENIRKKLKLPPEKVPYSLGKFGNTSSATIPLTLVNNLGQILNNSKQRLIFCGFGVGVSWATAYLETNNIVCPTLIEI